MGQWELYALTLNYWNIYIYIYIYFFHQILVWYCFRRSKYFYRMMRTQEVWPKKSWTLFMFFIFLIFQYMNFNRILLCSYCAFGGPCNNPWEPYPMVWFTHLPLLFAISHYFPVMTRLLPLIPLMLTSIFLSFVCCLPWGHLQRTRLKVQHQTTKSSKQVVSHILCLHETLSIELCTFGCVFCGAECMWETTQTKSDKNKQTNTSSLMLKLNLTSALLYWWEKFHPKSEIWKQSEEFGGFFQSSQVRNQK
jgi:hypothetical protein